ncbi:SDR family NAD(P)-dependent oxidoreductase [Lacrimispora sp. NSJ-141]|uniref:SDR family NAD(P)-dependent oxidoreductase n=2 Tax=Lientehia hominis TaxID=2897778 RepID=A0AAP2W8F6_9FIRM|nr:SDR family NAD(P)-dependent oxidoreductase [Lientehia hominis]MCD2493453.1 SDR family NAD(P)-dependent oxidoreductase [Lientehia hominis]
MKSMKQNKSKTVLITGASRGIGRSIALRFAREGFQTAICARGEQALLHTKQEIEAAGIPCLAVAADVGKAGGCRKVFTAVEKAFGHADILINNAGISHIGLLQDMTEAQWDEIMSINLSSVFYCCRLAIPSMIAAKHGKILNISSVWGSAGASCEVAYSASKGAVNSLTKALAKELAPSGIQVNALACGVIDTEMNHFLSPEDRASLIEEIPADRLGTPDEAAEMAFQIISSPAYLTGQVITLDGGWQ